MRHLHGVCLAMTAFGVAVCGIPIVDFPPPFVSSSQQSRKFHDLTYTFDNETIYWPTADRFKIDEEFFGRTDDGYFYSANHISASEHGGTHIDAPIHFVENGLPVDEIPLERLTGWGVIMDVSCKSLANNDYLITREDIEEWELRHKLPIPVGSIVLLMTGYGSFWPDAGRYLGTAERGAKAIGDLHFPGLSVSGAEALVERRIKAVGIDTASIDYGQSRTYEAHRVLLKQDIVVFENVANLDRLLLSHNNAEKVGPATCQDDDDGHNAVNGDIASDKTDNIRVDERRERQKGRAGRSDHTTEERHSEKLWAYVIALPMKIGGGSGAPLRLVAWK